MSQNAKFLLIILGAFSVAAIAGVLLTGLSGPSDDGVRCERSPIAQCTIGRTRFLGLGKSSFSVPQQAIRGARSVCAIGGRRSGCNVYLLTDGADGSILVSSYALAPPADSAAARLNEYFANPANPSVEIRDDVSTPALIFGVAPLLFVGLVIALRRWRLGSREPE
jgi:hypothetical protein